MISIMQDNGYSKMLIFILTVLLFSISFFIPISTIIIKSLSFLILLEIIRTIYDYVIHHDHRVKVRYIIDSGILFGMRELFVGWVMLKSTEQVMLFDYLIPNLVIGLMIMIISVITIGILLFYRVKVIMSSPDILEK